MRKVKYFLIIALLTGFLGVGAIIHYSDGKSAETSASVAVVANEVKEEPTLPTVEELLTLVNAERAKVGVKPLVLDPLLNKSAQLKSDELLREEWDDTPHVNDAGKHGYEYVSEAGAGCVYGSENLYTSSSQIASQDALNWWTNSLTHKEALLDSKYETTGFGISGTLKVYIVEHFCDHE